MRFRAIARPTATTFIAAGALVIALGGSAAVASGALQKGDNLIKKNSLSANRIRNHTITATQVKGLVWHPLTLENGWTAYPGSYGEAPAYAKDAFGFVHLRGTLDGSAKTAAEFATVPVGNRSNATHSWVVIGATDGDYGEVPAGLDAGNDGTLSAYEAPAGTYTFISLDGAEYYSG